MKRVRTMQLRILTVFLAIGICQCSYAEFWLGPPVNPGPEINSREDEWCVHVSDDGLTMVLSDSPFSQRGGGKGKIDIWIATRQDMDGPFSTPVNLSTINTSNHEFSPHLSADGLSLYFASDRPGGYGDLDLWVATRPDRTAPFGNPRNMGSAVNSGAGDFCPFLSSDGLSLYFNSSRGGGSGSCDIYVATRMSVDSSWTYVKNLGSRINTGATDASPVVSDDELTLYYVSNRSGGFGSDDLYVARRPSLSSAWGSPVNLGPQFNSARSDTAISFVRGSQTIFFCSSHPGGTGGVDIWEMPVTPIVDFNGDRIVDVMDYCQLANSWCKEELCADIAPGPLGDGRVDHLDLTVLSGYWLEEVPPVGLVAHWKLNETEGTSAQDSAGTHKGLLLGGPQWQPDDGAVGGALAFDGIDDYIYVPFVLNPEDGPFSVFMWVKGGGPGQVMISQIDTSGSRRAWLCCDTGEGRLMTELRPSGRSGYALSSDVVVSDGQWHRIGLMWDGSYRHLYVDHEEVAVDAGPQTSLGSLEAGMFIGVGDTLTQGSYFTGLLDDIRIYGRAVGP